MIVDLMRNDLGRVCEYGTIVAPRRPTAEPHPGLWHLVSHVHGRLRPGGRATRGACGRRSRPARSPARPRSSRLRVIAELEPAGREVYTGAIGFASPVAGLELNVAIRTLELAGGRVWLGAGGGIVADSEPRRELEEALAKARPIAAAVGTAVEVERPRPGRQCRLTARRASSRRCWSAGGGSTPWTGTWSAWPTPSPRCTARGCRPACAARLADEAAGLSGEHRLRVDVVPGAGVSVTTRPVAGGLPRGR